jgi:hypothetical protein
MLTAIVNHEYQHDKWITEVREHIGTPAPPVELSPNTTLVENYVVLGPTG